MNKLIIKKNEAQLMIEFLMKLTLRNRVSRLRNKLAKKLQTILTEYEEERVELAKEFANKDEKGEPIVNGDSYDISDLDGFKAEFISLGEEQVAIEVGEYSNNFSPLFEFLDSPEFDLEMSGQDAIVYDRLLDMWEEVNADDNSNNEREEN